MFKIMRCRGMVIFIWNGLEVNRFLGIVIVKKCVIVGFTKVCDGIFNLFLEKKGRKVFVI